MQTEKGRNANVSKINLDNIRLFAEARPEARWGNWRAEPDEKGKVLKPPTPPNNRPDKWLKLESAIKKLEGGRFDGVGLLIGSNTKEGGNWGSGLVGVDVDNCLDLETGDYVEGLESSVRLGIEELLQNGIWVEKSPSLTGIHAYYIGEKAEGILEKKKDEISGISREMYDSKSTRYLTCTGLMFKDSKPVLREMPKEFSLSIAEWFGILTEQVEAAKGGGVGTPRNLVELTDADIVAKVKQSGQGKGNKLFIGDISEYGGDHSAADLALALAIARYSDDATQVERVFSLSELAKRDKWKKRKDYRESTVKKALKSARDSAENANDAKTARIKKALVDGDSSGLLAEAVKAWGGKVPNTLAGLEKIISLDKRLEGALAYDDFSKRVLKLRSLRSCLGEVVYEDGEPKEGQWWSDADTAALTVWLGTIWGVTANAKQIGEAVDFSAMRFRFNTVVDKLENLKWDGKERLSKILTEYFNADDSLDSPKYLEAIGRCWMIGAVRRAYEPGVKMDNLWVLEGLQGFGKSNSIKTLACAVAPTTFKENLPDLSNNSEAERALEGCWICELAELSYQSKASTQHIKSFLSRTVDNFRSPYGRRDRSVPRTAVFAATTNEIQFVKDNAARRFWAFTVGSQIDMAKLAKDAPQLWAEAVVLFKAGEPHYITDKSVLGEAELAQGRRLETSVYDDLIEEKLVEPMIEGKILWREFYVQYREIWDRVNPQNPEAMVAQGRPFSDALVRKGFAKTKSHGKSMWKVGDVLEKRLLGIRGHEGGGLRLKA